MRLISHFMGSIIQLTVAISSADLGNKRNDVGITWIVDVRDLDDRHVCTGTIVSDVYVLAACSCVVHVDPTTKQKEKLQRRIVFYVRGARQERRSVNHFPHLLCDPVGKSGRPVHNYAVTLVDAAFDVPEHLTLTTDGVTAERRLAGVFGKAGKCESVGWTSSQHNGTHSLNLTTFVVKPVSREDVLEKSWLVGRAPFTVSTDDDGTPGRVLVCEGQPYGILDSWTNEDGVNRYYRFDHIADWVLTMIRER